ncbi:class I SAM-dependent methyltransferase [Candidatus Pacearchaeota archaeon]|nr:class I SAM-dependent methyltransferase [Candidatus Pacearchaeota archaeon]
MEDQKEIWNSIAQPWKTFRINPIEEVVEFLGDKKGNVLDLACGSGKNFTKIKGTIYGVDFSENMLKYAREFAEKNKINAQLIHAEADLLPFNDDFFDSVIFIAALHCIPEKKKRIEALRELSRVLKPNAEAMITVWDYNQEKFKDSEKESLISWKYNKKEYMRYYYLYEKDEFVNLLEKVGFKIVKVMDKDNPTGLYSKRNIIAIVKKP